MDEDFQTDPDPVRVRNGLNELHHQVAESRGHWVWYNVIFPPDSEDWRKLERFLKTELGFREDDWCAMNRDDEAHADWGPIEPPSRPLPWALWKPGDPDRTV